MNKGQLHERLSRAFHSVGAVTPADEPFARLIAAYSESHRRYHTLEHLDHCFAWLDWSWSLAEHPDEVVLALWYHDVIYDPLRRDNEAASALLAREVLSTASVPGSVIARVEAMIAATAAHEAQRGDAALLVDIDLTILGASEGTFARFEQQVREEYRMFDDATYAAGRARVLAKLLAREPLYVTEVIAGELTDRARVNLERSLLRWTRLAAG